MSSIPSNPISVVMVHHGGYTTNSTVIDSKQLRAKPNTTSFTKNTTIQLPSERHKKETRQRGCPCCDRDRIDNIVDRMLFMDAPP